MGTRSSPVLAPAAWFQRSETGAAPYIRATIVRAFCEALTRSCIVSPARYR